MKKPALIDTRSDLQANVVKFAQQITALASKSSSASQAIGNGCSHAVEWVAFSNEEAGWYTAFSKYAGYNGLTFQLYDQLRQTQLSGTETKRRIEKLGGVVYGVGADAGIPGNHPAVDAVKSMCALFGKAPKRTARVRVFPAEQRPIALTILNAAIRAANLTKDELETLFLEMREAA